MTELKRPTTVLEAKALIGSWRLVSCEHIGADGAVEHPFGISPVGQLVYAPDGRMMVLITDPSRPPARSSQFFEAKDAELAQAAKGCVAYSGLWRLRGGTVIHDVEQSLFPNWTGHALVRFVKLEGRRLTLSTGAFSVGASKYAAARLAWEKETPAAWAQ